ncbi:N-(5'-phosphoribosyl)anthranilate isomerase [Paenibacillus swuensis]|uniref:N-(5'-phosphoribosyl)anthranilate isomerase n=1 Tax=Paenibacillus swuensis TaxID=1178515 RepID=A0A172TPN2_9BACL|nr:N-(5'-phosphoribosyl)anthranilate isomerase [Paenibacillus swuensis]
MQGPDKAETRSVPKVKICGLQSVEVLKSIVNLPVDYIGIVFAPSRRQVEANQAAQLILASQAWEVDPRPLIAGVFVNPDFAELKRVLSVARLDIIQLHGQETPQFCSEVREKLRVQVYKAFAVKDAKEEPVNVLERLQPYTGHVDGILIDTYDPVTGGGTGQVFGWEAIPPYSAWAREHNLPLLIAGGLHEGNVSELIYKYDVYGVDISSGVETNGVKDPARIQAFVERVKTR